MTSSISHPRSISRRLALLTLACSAVISRTSYAAPFALLDDINGHKNVIPDAPKTKPIKVAIFQGGGAPEGGIVNTGNNITAVLPQVELTRIVAEEWATADLTKFDVVVFSGGSGSKQAEAIGEEGRKNVREYVRNGGGYYGVCAGAYLASAGFPWSLGIINAKTVGQKWQRGQAYLDIEPSPEGSKFFAGVKESWKVRYHNGPILVPANKSDLPNFTPVAFFRSEVRAFDNPEGEMLDKPAHAYASFGKGRVFVSSPHPENTAGLENLTPRAILWAAGVIDETGNKK